MIRSGRWSLQFLSFAVVGCIGFVVDVVALYTLLHGAGLGLYWSRLGSYLAAATATWWLNRSFTFRPDDAASPAGQWLRFVLLNTVGGAVNLGVYAAMVTFWSVAAAHPVLGVAAGSIAGLAINFTLSKAFVFSRS
ncbi:MAG: GtrA family protein [Pseudomonadota bacterium]